MFRISQKEPGLRQYQFLQCLITEKIFSRKLKALGIFVFVRVAFGSGCSVAGAGGGVCSVIRIGECPKRRGLTDFCGYDMQRVFVQTSQSDESLWLLQPIEIRHLDTCCNAVYRELDAEDRLELGRIVKLDTTSVW